MHTSRRSFFHWTLAIGLSCSLAAAAKSQEPPTYELKYKCAVGDEVRWRVVHVVTVDTKIKGVSQTAKTRSVSSKLWKVTGVDESGNITFAHIIEDVDMWQSVTGREDVTYNSQTDKVPPSGYEHVAESLKGPLATVTITPQGMISNRKDARPQFNPGIGELTLPMPVQAVKVGAKWRLPEELKVRLADGRVQTVKTQQVYTLKEVADNVATIEIETQVLTPIEDPKVQSQLVQRLTRGEATFDIAAGRLVSKKMDLDETVLGFEGAESMMHYLARFTETLQTSEASVAEKPAATDEDSAQK
jgi:hypothetical protein